MPLHLISAFWAWFPSLYTDSIWISTSTHIPLFLLCYLSLTLSCSVG